MFENQHCSVFLESVKYSATTFTTGFYTTLYNVGPALLHAAAVDVDHLEAWREAPYMTERNFGKLTAQLGGYTNATAEGGQLVAETFPQNEAGVGHFPNTVDTVCAVWLGKYFLELTLKCKKLGAC